MDNIIYFTEAVPEPVNIKIENIPFEEVSFQEDKQSVNKKFSKNHPLKFTESTISNEIKVENTEDELICQICDQTFDTPSELIEHKESHFDKPDEENNENETQKYECDICHKTFKARNYYNRHIAKHNKEREHICEICQKDFSTTRLLKEHMSTTHYGHKMFTCKICSMQFVNRSGIFRHIEIHTKRPTHICHICGKAFMQKQSLIDHIFAHTGEKRFECDVCYKRFVHRNTLRIHKFLHDPSYTRVCEKCGQKYQSRKKSEENSCYKCIKPFTCEICNRVLMHKGSFQRHIKLHTGTVEYTCNVCNQGFIQKVAYNLHMKKHKKQGEVVGYIENISKLKNKNEEKQVEDGENYCHICDERLSSEEEVQNHIELHKDCQSEDLQNVNEMYLIENYNYCNSKYTCSQCQKTFSKREKLMEHLENHKKESSLKKYQEKVNNFKKCMNLTMRFCCEICSLRFTHNDMLEKHMLTHLGENNIIKTSESEKILNEISIDKQLVCDICKGKFINKISLEKHMETHSNSLQGTRSINRPSDFIETVDIIEEQNFSCPKCFKKFINQISFENHLKLHENEPYESLEKRRIFKARTNGITAEKFIQQNKKSYGGRKIKYVQCPEIVIDSNSNGNKPNVDEISLPPSDLAINSEKNNFGEIALPDSKLQVLPSTIVPKQIILPPKSAGYPNSPDVKKNPPFLLVKTSDNKLLIVSPNVSKLVSKDIESTTQNQNLSPKVPVAKKINASQKFICEKSKLYKVVDVPKNILSEVLKPKTVDALQKSSGETQKSSSTTEKTVDILQKRLVMTQKSADVCQKNLGMTQKSAEALQKSSTPQKSSGKSEKRAVLQTTSTTKLLQKISDQKSFAVVAPKSSEVSKDCNEISQVPQKSSVTQSQCGKTDSPVRSKNFSMIQKENKNITSESVDNLQEVECFLPSRSAEVYDNEIVQNLDLGAEIQNLASRSAEILLPNTNEQIFLFDTDNPDVDKKMQNILIKRGEETQNLFLEKEKIVNWIPGSAENQIFQNSDIDQNATLMNAESESFISESAQKVFFESAEILNSNSQIAEKNSLGFQRAKTKKLDSTSAKNPILLSQSTQEDPLHSISQSAENQTIISQNPQKVSSESVEIQHSISQSAEKKILDFQSVENGNSVSKSEEVPFPIMENIKTLPINQEKNSATLVPVNPNVSGQNVKNPIFMSNGVPVQLYICMDNNTENKKEDKKLKLVYIPIQTPEKEVQIVSHNIQKPNESNVSQNFNQNATKIEEGPKICEVYSLNKKNRTPHNSNVTTSPPSSTKKTSKTSIQKVKKSSILSKNKKLSKINQKGIKSSKILGSLPHTNQKVSQKLLQTGDGKKGDLSSVIGDAEVQKLKIYTNKGVYEMKLDQFLDKNNKILPKTVAHTANKHDVCNKSIENLDTTVTKKDHGFDINEFAKNLNPSDFIIRKRKCARDDKYKVFKRPEKS